MKKLPLQFSIRPMLRFPMCRISESGAKEVCYLGRALGFQIKVSVFLILLRVALKVLIKVITLLIKNCEWLTVFSNHGKCEWLLLTEFYMLVVAVSNKGPYWNKRFGQENWGHAKNSKSDKILNQVLSYEYFLRKKICWECIMFNLKDTIITHVA